MSKRSHKQISKKKRLQNLRDISNLGIDCEAVRDTDKALCILNSNTPRGQLYRDVVFDNVANVTQHLNHNKFTNYQITEITLLATLAAAKKVATMLFQYQNGKNNPMNNTYVISYAVLSDHDWAIELANEYKVNLSCAKYCYLTYCEFINIEPKALQEE